MPITYYYLQVMTNEDLFTAAENKQASQPVKSNVPEMRVSELAFSLKRTLEETYGHVRVRGEISGMKLASSGHLYADLKDEEAVINIICWRGTLGKLSVKPEDGLDVIITGKVSSYPKSSRYQIIVDKMELAGEGALLKMLAARKKKLAGEGLFDAQRKKPLPFLPSKIGVITSPTGAVIRDILHRLEDRFPMPVLLWPVAVQGDAAASQIAAAIRGFNTMLEEERPDLLIVARGGGSLEDLMAFNEEEVVRAAAESSIPLISAVGHETDVTLIDYAADARAPTPTGAAEMAVPVRANLFAQILEDEQRLVSAMNRLVRDGRQAVTNFAARLGDPQRLLEVKAQSLDFQADKLQRSFSAGLQQKASRISELAAKIRHPKDRVAEAQRLLSLHTAALTRAGAGLLKGPQKHLDHTGRMLESLSFKRVLERGFAVVRDEGGKVIARADMAKDGQNAQIEFADQTLAATLGKAAKSG